MKLIRMMFFSLLFVLIALPAYSAGRLTLYCSPQIEWCELMVNEFEKRTGIRVGMTRMSVQTPKAMSGGAVLEIHICRQPKKG